MTPADLVDTDAQRGWAALGPTWQAAFELAWESFVHGSVAVGAVVTDAASVIVARGRSRSREPIATPGQLGNATVAHAEINALGQLPPIGGRPGYSIYTTLEPCVMCAAAIVIARIGSVHYAGADVLWSGLERLPELNAFVASRWPARFGPRHDEFSAMATLLPLLFYVENYPEGAATASHKRSAPHLLAAARGIVESGQHRRWATLPLATALEEIWPWLNAIGRPQ